MVPEKEILKVLTYFDIFHYPLTATEIRKFLNKSIAGSGFDEVLDKLHHDNRIFKINGFYCLRNDPSLAARRIEDNERAENLLKTAYKICSFLFQFPYVRGIGISGSLSKKVAAENADIDFFIITKKNRLWIARTAMHLFKKFTFIFGRQHWFCMNYYVDEDALVIQEKNIFTATEVVTLLPVCGNNTLKRFFKANDWAQMYFPNYELHASSYKKGNHSFLKVFTESLLDNRFGDWLDNYLARLTSGRWLKKERDGRRNSKGNHMGLRSGKHFARPNPAFLQQRILLLYESKLKELDVVAEKFYV